MSERTQSIRLFAFGIVAAGCGLALLGSVRPHYATGYHLHAGILIAGLVPYVLYAALTEFIRSPLLIAIGGAVLLIHLVLILG
jgi:hypothetical protein